LTNGGRKYWVHSGVIHVSYERHGGEGHESARDGGAGVLVPLTKKGGKKTATSDSEKLSGDLGKRPEILERSKACRVIEGKDWPGSATCSG